MFGKLSLLVCTLQIGSYISVNYANPVTNFGSGDTFVFELPKSQDAQSLSSRVSSLSAAGRSYGETSAQNQATGNSQSSSANGRILSQPSTSDKDAITYPDDIIRDSYGNIVTPYTTLLEDTVPLHPSTPSPSNLGLLTDVNRDNGQHLQLVIPSYSDGITELQGPYKPSSTHSAITPPLQTLLPPLSSGNYNYPSLDTHKTSVTSVDNSYQNEIGGSFPSSSSSQNLNPLPTGPSAITTNGHIGGSNNSPSTYTPNLQVPFSSPSIVPSQSNKPSYETQSNSDTSSPVFFSKPNQSFTSNQNSASTPGSSDFSAIHVSSAESNAPISSFAFTNTQPLRDTQIVNQKPINIQVDSGKYTGGFGGAVGILGEQKVPGYAVKPTVSKPNSTPSSQVNNDHPGFNSVHANSPLNTPSYGTQSAPQIGTLGQSNSNHGSFQFGTAFSPNPTPSTQVNNNNKYNGGFGGPPGIYSPFDNVKSGKNLGTSSPSDPKRKY